MPNFVDLEPKTPNFEPTLPNFFTLYGVSFARFLLNVPLFCRGLFLASMYNFGAYRSTNDEFVSKNSMFAAIAANLLGAIVCYVNF